MIPFLKQVAEYLYTNSGSSIKDYKLIFPSRRAGVFFNAYLNEIIDKPIIGPETTTINQFVSEYSAIQQADQLLLVLKLQQIYNEVTGFNETLDEFYFWGEILLSDFDDIDKYLINADDLFTNISDLKELEQKFDYLSENQKKAIENFWGSIAKTEKSTNKDKFIELWNKLAIIYHRFRKELLTEKLGYSGLIYRELAESENLLDVVDNGFEKYVFIGFNALNNCEKAMFKKLHDCEKAMFFWDFDEGFLKDADHEAGYFLRRNLIQFPAPSDFILNSDNHQKTKKVSMVSVPGKMAQAQIVNAKSIIGDIQKSDRFDNTAFVLADESLLVPLISATGSKFDKVNITMGYSLTNTPVYGFVSQLMNLQRNVRKSKEGEAVFYFKPVVSLLNHQFVNNSKIADFIKVLHRQNKIYLNPDELSLDALTSKVFSIQEGWSQTLDYLSDCLLLLLSDFQNSEEEPVSLEAEYTHQALLAIRRLNDSLAELNPQEFSQKVLFRIVDQHLRRISIPFEGEPLTGLQVMGLLETRCLDFKNLILFSANEGNLPQTVNTHSFIPYHLRKGHGVPTFEERDAMYAYYFYNLIQRAENAIFVYNSTTDGSNASEMSRYLFQLLYESDYEIQQYSLNFDFKGTQEEQIAIMANKRHQQILINKYTEKNLSPSAINSYLDCKLKFYFKYIVGLKELDELKEEIDPVLFGNLFHYAVELVYKPFQGKEISKDDLDAIIVNKNKIEKIILQSFAEKYFKLKPDQLSKVKLNGHSLLIAGHLQNYLVQLLKKDRDFAPFSILELEGEHVAEFKIDGIAQKIKVGGIIDRIDQTKDGVRIVDYKTGRNLDLNFTDWGQLTNRDSSTRKKEILQTLIYSKVYQISENCKEAILPTIYKLDNLFQEDFIPGITQNRNLISYQTIESEFEGVFDDLLKEIFSEDNIYDQVKETRKCTYCPFNKICNRAD